MSENKEYQDIDKLFKAIYNLISSFRDQSIHFFAEMMDHEKIEKGDYVLINPRFDQGINSFGKVVKTYDEEGKVDIKNIKGEIVSWEWATIFKIPENISMEQENWGNFN